MIRHDRLPAGHLAGKRYPDPPSTFFRSVSAFIYYTNPNNHQPLCTLLVEPGDHRNAALDPLLLRVPLRRRDANVHDEVRGVARGQQHAAALRGLVHGAVVDVGRAADGALCEKSSV